MTFMLFGGFSVQIDFSEDNMSAEAKQKLKLFHFFTCQLYKSTAIKVWTEQKVILGIE